MIKVNNKEIVLNRFPDGTLNLKADNKPKHSSVEIQWFYHDDAEFMALAFLTKYYKTNGCRVRLFMPYVPNARMDRMEHASDIFSLKYFAWLINSLGFEQVAVVDPHSNVVQAVINNCCICNNGNQSFFEQVVSFVKTDLLTEDHDELMMFFPDEGAMKRYSKNVNMPYAFGVKKRDWQTGNIIGLDIMGMDANQIKGKNILIRDDICSKGGTFYHSAKKLKELGANHIYLMVTHCEDSILNGEFGSKKENLLDTGLIKHVYTTNSICSLENNDKITVFAIL